MSAFSLPIMSMPGGGGTGLGGFQKHRYGNSGVYYDDEGRMVHSARQPASTYPRPDDDDRYSYDSRRERRKSMRRDGPGYSPGPQRGGDRRYEPRRVPYAMDPYAGTHPGAAPVTRRQQGYAVPSSRMPRQPLSVQTMQTRPMPHNNGMANGAPTMVQQQQRYQPPPQFNYNNRPEDYRPEGYRPEDYRTYDSEDQKRVRPWWIMFLLNGILMIILGVLNILFCEHWHHYFRFWAGLTILEVGIVGLLHRGDYYNQWQNWCYMLSGTLSAILSFVGTALLLEKLAPQIIRMAAIDDTGDYIDLEKARDVDTVLDVSAKTRVWVCLAVDCTSQLSLIGGMAAMGGVCLVADKFWKNNYQVLGSMSPFCTPWLFNSYSQILWAEAVAFLGLITVYSCADVASGTEWHDYWGPVWSGIITAIAGGLTVAAIKRDDIFGLTLLALIMQVLSLLACIGAFILCAQGISDDADYLDQDGVPGFMERHVKASAGLFAITNLLLLVAFFFSAHGIYRLVRSMKKSQQTKRPDRGPPQTGTPMPDYNRYGQDRWYSNGWPRRDESRY